MPNVLVRDVEESVLERLKLRAKRQNRSLQSEMKIILREAAEKRDPLTELELIRKIKGSIKKVQQTDSVELLREDRNR